MRKTKAQRIEEAMKAFDFERVHYMLSVTGWAWFSPATGETRTPTMDDLLQAARGVVTDVADGWGKSTHGGFTARLDDYCEKGKRITLAFEIASASA